MSDRLKHAERLEKRADHRQEIGDSYKDTSPDVADQFYKAATDFRAGAAALRELDATSHRANACREAISRAWTAAWTGSLEDIKAVLKEVISDPAMNADQSPDVIAERITSLTARAEAAEKALGEAKKDVESMNALYEMAGVNIAGFVIIRLMLPDAAKWDSTTCIWNREIFDAAIERAKG